jgi:hypothetical protein
VDAANTNRNRGLAGKPRKLFQPFRCSAFDRSPAPPPEIWRNGERANNLIYNRFSIVGMMIRDSIKTRSERFFF